MESLIYKLGGLVKDLDEQKRIVTGYFTNTGTLDSDMDVFEYGAFQKTIAEHGPESKNKIWHLWMHDVLSPINKPRTLYEDDKGVYFETSIPDTELGNFVLELYKQGAISEHSVGFNIVKWEHDKDQRIIKEAKMWEGSTVLWGANENTPFEGLKQKHDALKSIIKNGKFSDQTHEILEMKLKQMAQRPPLEPEQRPPLKPEQESLIKLVNKLNI